MSTHPVDQQPLLVGRGQDCQIRIDSLAVAAQHALVSRGEDGFSIRALDPEHPVRINRMPVAEARLLSDGDILQIGKHTLVFSCAPINSPPPPQTAKEEPAADRGSEPRENRARECIGAYLQVESGAELGKILTFRRAVTRLTKLGADHVIVTKDGDALSLALLTDDSEASIDGLDIGHDIDVPLRNGSILEVNGIRCRFFCG